MVRLLADVVDPSSPAFWTSAGIGGFAILAFVKGWIVPGYVLDRAEERIKDQEERIERLTATFSDKLLPALDKQVQTNERVTDALLANRSGR